MMHAENWQMCKITLSRASIFSCSRSTLRHDDIDHNDNSATNDMNNNNKLITTMTTMTENNNESIHI